jgi:hypothetical protein
MQIPFQTIRPHTIKYLQGPTHSCKIELFPQTRGREQTCRQLSWNPSAAYLSQNAKVSFFFSFGSISGTVRINRSIQSSCSNLAVKQNKLIASQTKGFCPTKMKFSVDHQIKTNSWQDTIIIDTMLKFDFSEQRKRLDKATEASHQTEGYTVIFEVDTVLAIFALEKGF